MKITKSEILNVLQKVKPALAKKDIVEQFTHFIFTGEEVMTFNDEICISHPFKTDFKCSARAEDLYKALNGIKETEVDISVKDDQLIIKSGKTKAGMSTSVERKAEELIAALELESLAQSWITIADPEEFCKGAFLSMFSASSDMTQGVLTCVCIEGDRMVSSDEIRISFFQMDKPTELKVLIPARNVAELVKFPVTEYVLTDTWCHFRTEDNIIFSTRILAGDYPDLSDFFEVEGKQIALPKELKDTVDSIAFMTEDKLLIDRHVDIKVEDGKISCRAEKDIGWIEKDIDFEAEDKAHFTINPNFLSQILDKATTLTIGDSAALFLSDKFRHVISLT